MIGGLLAFATATAALIVVCTSATISLTSLAWQLTLYRLSGARLEVGLSPAILNCNGHIYRGGTRGWRRPPPREAEALQLEHGFVDLAVIQVTNVGRSPITVSDLTLDFGWRNRPWWRHTVGSTPVPVFEGVGDTASVRFEAGASSTMYVDHTPLVEWVRANRPKVRAMRASARGAGRRPMRSPRRQRWKLTRGRSATWPYPPPITSEIEVFRHVFRVVYPRDVTKLYDTWVAIGALYVGGETPTPEDIRRLLETRLEMSGPAMDIMQAAFAIAGSGYGGPE